MSLISAGLSSRTNELLPDTEPTLRMKKMPIVFRSVRWLLSGVILVWSPPSGAAFAGTLPVVLDAAADEPMAWWTGQPTVDSMWHRSVSAAALNDRRWLDPLTLTPTQQPAGLLLRLDTTASNARALARLYGADAVLFGRFYVVQQSDVPWLGLRRCEVGVTGELISVESGLNRATPSVTASAYRVDAAEACQMATELLVQVVSDYLPGEGERPVGIVGEGLEIVVRSPASALPFVGFRSALRTVHPSISDVVEDWAAEGRISLRLVLSELADLEAVALAIEAMPARSDEYQIDSMEREGMSIRVTVRTPLPELAE
ncbi:MAG: hypothetical protein KGO50_19715 [Myxococcales bacterium]|nr:hypothetical protein [Myxococcales bacterium]